MHTTNRHTTTERHNRHKQSSQAHYASIVESSIAHKQGGTRSIAQSLSQCDERLVSTGLTSEFTKSLENSAEQGRSGAVNHSLMSDAPPDIAKSQSEASLLRADNPQQILPERLLFDVMLKRFKRPGLSATRSPSPNRSRKLAPRKLVQRSSKRKPTSRQPLPLPPIQHHHAHVAACLAENHCPLHARAVLSVALDEFDYSENGTLWGGEFFLANYRHCQRVGTFKPVSVLNAGQTLDRPWCNTYSHLIAAFDWEDLQAVYGDLELLQFLNQQPRSVLSQLLIQRVQAPLTSSVSCLFDAVATAIGIGRSQPICMGHGSLALAALVQPEHLDQVQDSSYPFELKYLGRDTALPYLESRSMWQALLEDLLQHTPTALMAARFHVGLSQAIGQMVAHLQEQYAFQQVALTGKVFQNSVLLQQVTQCLSQLGLAVFTHRLFPCRHADLLLGQVAIATARLV
ncbi:Kae1-like domain-containing protein [Thermocoleostomius sinensis]|uniref:HypF Kae1-like domain-containing protein n=1 Tax=Thermocoleostomius sinensis A174 TaxID=2016057 RepID=A0A9E8ZEY2_9CYAN|nr:hypothetical protein [Thermocoleostomius sinensis]WAL61918.1 hypothetical protein OXH18_08020 [Thermocoleostomius sinensis A174]